MLLIITELFHPIYFPIRNNIRFIEPDHCDLAWVILGWLRLTSRLHSNMEEHPLLSTEQIIPALAFLTFGITIVYAIVHFFLIPRKREALS